MPDEDDTPPAVKRFLDDLAAGLDRLAPEDQERVIRQGDKLLADRRRKLDTGARAKGES